MLAVTTHPRKRRPLCVPAKAASPPCLPSKRKAARRVALPESGKKTSGDKRGRMAQQRTRTGTKTLFCSYGDCGYSCARPGDLKQHLRVHSQEKPFVCCYEGCGYASTQAANLKRHLRHHSGEKLFVGPREGEGRVPGRLARLRQHGRVHTHKDSLSGLREAYTDMSVQWGVSCGQRSCPRDSADASSRATMTVASAVPQSSGGKSVSDKAESVFAGLGMSPWPLSQAAARAGRPPVPAQHSERFHWLAEIVDETFSWPLYLPDSTDAVDTDAVPLALTDDDKMFWRRLLAPVDTYSSRSAP